jgi:hypothetical protein
MIVVMCRLESRPESRESREWLGMDVLKCVEKGVVAWLTWELSRLRTVTPALSSGCVHVDSLVSVEFTWYHQELHRLSTPDRGVTQRGPGPGARGMRPAALGYDVPVIR